MSDHLLPEILVEIFLKLPLETLVRCTCTCKLWNSIITSPSFITLHLNHTTLSNKNKRSPLLIRQFIDRPSKKETFSIHLVNDSRTLEKQAEIQFPYVAEVAYFRVSSSINGVMLLCCDLLSHTEKYILYNPSIRKHLILPSPNIDFDSFHYHAIAFGYAAKTNDYKVVRIVYLEIEDGFEYCSPHVVQIYSLNAGAWHDVRYAHAPCCHSERPDGQAFMNGFIHWISADREGNCGNSRFLLVFDVEDETFSKMKMPQSCADGLAYLLSVRNFGECLSLVQYDKDDVTFRCCCTIWVMKEYGAADSWTKLYTFDLEKHTDIIGMLKMDELLLLRKYWYFGLRLKTTSELVLYNIETGENNYLGVSSVGDSLYVAAHVESLVLMARVNTFSIGRSTQ